MTKDEDRSRHMDEGLSVADTVGVAYLQRELSALARRALKTFPIVVVTGLRQAGKTTFLQCDSAFRGRRYVTLDDFAALEAARLDPESLIHEQ